MFSQWASKALDANISAINKVVHTFRRNLKGILNAAITGHNQCKA
jgi:hypothetical protein